MGEAGGMCDHCQIVYLENGSFDAIWVDDGTTIAYRCDKSKS